MDFLGTSLVLAIISSILSQTLMIGLSLLMGLIAVVCLVVVRLVRSKRIRVQIQPDVQRVFKNDKFPIDSTMSMSSPRWVSARFASLQAPLGVEAKSVQLSKDSIQIIIEPRFAGRHKGLSVTVTLSDPLDLFTKEVDVQVPEFSIDALPNSLLAPFPRSKPASLGLGDSTSRFSGSNLELYAIQDYLPFGETKNILWKKVARMPDERLMIRQREASNPRSIKIGFLKSARRQRLEDRVRFMDKVCESIGFLGNTLFAMGSSIEIISSSRSALISSMRASSIEELIEILMGMWDGVEVPLSHEEVLDLVLDSDVVVTGFREVQDRNLAILVSKKLALLIKEGTSPPAFASEKTTVYSGNEDLRGIISRLIEK